LKVNQLQDKSWHHHEHPLEHSHHLLQLMIMQAGCGGRTWRCDHKLFIDMNEESDHDKTEYYFYNFLLKSVFW